MSAAALEPRWRGRLSVGLLLAPALLWLGALIVLPHVDLAVLSFRERVGPRHYVASLAQYRTFFTEPLYWHVFVRTAVMSVIATFLTLVLAFPIAWVIAKLARGRASSLLFMLCLIPFWVSETVRTLGWMILLRESGVLPSLLVKLGITQDPRRASLPRRDHHGGTGVYLAPFHGDPARVQPGKPGQRPHRGGVRSRRRRLHGPAHHRDPARGARYHGRLHRRVHADSRQLLDTRTLLGGKSSQWFTEQIYNQFITRFNWEQGAALGFLLLALSTALVILGLKLAGQRFGDVMRRT
jgi:spermidine/putrescine transport system permease protein